MAKETKCSHKDCEDNVHAYKRRNYRQHWLKKHKQVLPPFEELRLKLGKPRLA